jgi:PleD family two-component response regulator
MTKIKTGRVSMGGLVFHQNVKRILVADLPQMEQRYSSALAGWDIAFARTMGQAREALAGGRYDLVAVGVYFDDSQIFDLVRAVRRDPRHRDVPIVCVRSQTGCTAVSGRTLESAVKDLGAEQLIELAALGDDAAGEGALRAAAEQLVRD